MMHSDEHVLQSLGGLQPDPTLHDDLASSDDEDVDEDPVRPADYATKAEAKRRAKEERKRKELKGRRPPRFFVIVSVTFFLRSVLRWCH